MQIYTCTDPGQVHIVYNNSMQCLTSFKFLMCRVYLIHLLNEGISKQLCKLEIAIREHLVDHVYQLHLSFLHQRLTNGGRGGKGREGRGRGEGEGGRGGRDRRKNNMREAEVARVREVHNNDER